MAEKRVIRGGRERALGERRRTVHRLLETPEQVSPEEAHAFLDGVRAEFQAFVRRQKLHDVKATKATKTTRRVAR